MLDKFKGLFVAVIIPFAFFSGVVIAADYNSMTTEELNALRGTLQNVSAEEREAFKEEWQERMAELTQAERDEYLTSGPGRGGGNGTGNTGGSGSGGGSRNGNDGSGSDGGNGNGGGKGRK